MLTERSSRMAAGHLRAYTYTVVEHHRSTTPCLWSANSSPFHPDKANPRESGQPSMVCFAVLHGVATSFFESRCERYLMLQEVSWRYSCKDPMNDFGISRLTWRAKHCPCTTRRDKSMCFDIRFGLLHRKVCLRPTMNRFTVNWCR